MDLEAERYPIHSSRSQRGRPARTLTPILLTVVAVLVGVPLIFMLAYAFRDAPLNDRSGTWGLDSWQVIWGPGTLELMGRSALFVSIALVVGGALSLPSAWLLERAVIRGRRVWRTLIVASMALAPGVLAFS